MLTVLLTDHGISPETIEALGGKIIATHDQCQSPGVEGVEVIVEADEEATARIYELPHQRPRSGVRAAGPLQDDGSVAAWFV